MILAERNRQTGFVFWLTGLSGAGKTTVGLELTKKLKEQGYPVIFLDGDALRGIVGDVFGHDRAERLKASLLYSRLCQMLAEQSINVVCATISLFHETQNWNRENISNYIEVFLDVPLVELYKRDSKLIYSKANKGDMTNIVGLDIVPEYPKNPEIIVKNFGENEVSHAVSKILQLHKHRIFECRIEV